MTKGPSTVFRCDNCGYESNRYFGLCPKCGDGTGQEITLEPEASPGSLSGGGWGDRTGFEYSGPPVEELLRKVDENAGEDVIVRRTKYPGLNAIISTGKGFVEAQVCLLGASPGVGKSTLCVSIADERTLYVSSEENFRQVNQRVLRVNPTSGCTILNSTRIDVILEAIKKWQGDTVIIDSLNSIEFGVGYSTVARFAAEITQTIKSCNKVGIIISQVTRSGEITGMNSIIHVVDTVLHLERSEVSNNIICTSSKNRFGEVGGVAVFQHQSDGFVEVDVDERGEAPDVGSTFTETRFGHKLMTISMEALVAPSQAAFGLRKANGYNANRVMQVVGILSYFGRINLTQKDIYVAVSSGLYTDDVCVELAIANSILSSYYGAVKLQSAYGELRLNGRISNGTMVKVGSLQERPLKIKHINELIELYAEEAEAMRKRAAIRRAQRNGGVPSDHMTEEG